jgi:nucleolar protein 9
MPSVNGPSQVLRSKKSTSWKARQGQMKSVFNDESQLSGKAKFRAPTSFTEAAKKFALMIRQKLGPNEVRALAADKVASPVLQVFISVFSFSYREWSVAHDSSKVVVGS